LSSCKIDPRLLAAEIGATVAEFNRSANLASAEGLLVQAEILMQPMVDQPSRLVLSAQVVKPLAPNLGDKA